MQVSFTSIKNKLGIDGAIVYTILARVLQAGGGVISILFVAKYLNKVEQGYYYTFGSILAIQIFFELGLSGIITQFVAHEAAQLNWSGTNQIDGPENSKSRLASLLRFCLKWFFTVSVFLAILLLIVGNLFFYKYGSRHEHVQWQLPWTILCITTSCSLIVSPILAFLEGLNMIKEVAQIRLIQQLTQLVLLLLLLIFGLKLFAGPIAAFFAFLIIPVWIYFSSKKALLALIWQQFTSSAVNYREEIFPYQWRIALSWISGYFIFNLFNPVLFATEGPIVAGQMGLTLAALNGVLSVSLSWINTKVPAFSSLIARRSFSELDRLFNITVKQASLMCGACLIIFAVAIITLQSLGLSVGFRFLPVTPLILLCLCTFVNQLVSALATYLRCHKQEPFLIHSITLGLLTACSTLLLGHFYGLNGIVIGYSSLIIFVSLTWAVIIFKTKKAEWH